MKEFFTILFFSKFILLTPESIDLTIGKNNIELKEPLEAITTGASVQIDVSHLLQLDGSEGVFDVKNKVDERVPAGSVSSTLTSVSGQYLLSYDGGILFRDAQVLINLVSKEGLPVNQEFTQLEVTTKISLSNVNVYWRNFNK